MTNQKETLMNRTNIELVEKLHTFACQYERKTMEIAKQLSEDR